MNVFCGQVFFKLFPKFFFEQKMALKTILVERPKPFITPYYSLNSLPKKNLKGESPRRNRCSLDPGAPSLLMRPKRCCSWKFLRKTANMKSKMPKQLELTSKHKNIVPQLVHSALCLLFIYKPPKSTPNCASAQVARARRHAAGRSFCPGHHEGQSAEGASASLGFHLTRPQKTQPVWRPMPCLTG